MYKKDCLWTTDIILFGEKLKNINCSLSQENL